MNTYKTTFFTKCPVNSVRVAYNLTIETESVIAVEKLLESVEGFQDGYHENIADELFAKFGGVQTITAFHHGVEITTTRS